MDDAFVLGFGFVGRATALALDIPHHFSRNDSNITLEEGAKKKLCFVCLPTPTNDQGSQSEAVNVIMDYIKQIRQYSTGTIFVIRSTVLPGTCRHIADQTGAVIVSNPEFLSETTADYDAAHPRIKVIGSDSIPVLQLVKERWSKIRCKLEIDTDPTTAELIKYTFNTFAMVKVVFANQIYDVAEKVGANYEHVHMALHRHPWGSKNHFKVFHKKGRGASGHCIPKDVKAFSAFTASDFFKDLWQLNQQYLEGSGKQ